MKRKTLETTVLVLGLVIIGVALFLMFAVDKTYKSLFITNITFALGFLIYIIYTIMSTNSLNLEIRGLQGHVAALKDTIKKKDHQLEEKSNRIEDLEQQNHDLSAKNEELQDEVKNEHNRAEKLSKELKENRTSQQ